jgi:hypothetical protein
MQGLFFKAEDLAALSGHYYLFFLEMVHPGVLHLTSCGTSTSVIVQPTFTFKSFLRE